MQDIANQVQSTDSLDYRRALLECPRSERPTVVDPTVSPTCPWEAGDDEQPKATTATLPEMSVEQIEQIEKSIQELCAPGDLLRGGTQAPPPQPADAGAQSAPILQPSSMMAPTLRRVESAPEATTGH